MQTFVSGSKAGERVYFDIQIFDDDVVETEEFFSVVLETDTDSIIHTATAYVQITDNDCKQSPNY